MTKFILDAYFRGCPKANGWFGCKAYKAVRSRPIGDMLRVVCDKGELVPFGLAPGSLFEANVCEVNDSKFGKQLLASGITLVNPPSESDVAWFLTHADAFNWLEQHEIDQLIGVYGADILSCTRDTTVEIQLKCSDWLLREGLQGPLISEFNISVFVDCLLKSSIRPLIRQVFPSLRPQACTALWRTVTNKWSEFYKMVDVTDAQEAIRAIIDDPYLLAFVSGISWDTADVEVITDFPQKYSNTSRVESAVWWTMSRVLGASKSEGASSIRYEVPREGAKWTAEDMQQWASGEYLDMSDVTLRNCVRDLSSRLLDKTCQAILSDAQLDDVLSNLEKRGRIVIDTTQGGTDVYKPHMKRARDGIAASLKDMSSTMSTRRNEVSSLLKSYSDSSGRTLTSHQQRALYSCLVSPVSVLTGGPGCGKTFSLQAIVSVFSKLNKRSKKDILNKVNVYCLGPTGKSVRRMQEFEELKAENVMCMTAHRFVAKQRSSCRKDKPYGDFITGKSSLLIIDEAGMLDTVLLFEVLSYVAPGTQIIFVGDQEQLPPISAGDVLRCLIESGTVCGRLLDNLRSGSASGVVTCANAMVKGDIATALCPTAGVDFEWLKNDEDIDATVVARYKTLVGNGESIEDIAVLASRNKCVSRVAEAIRDFANPICTTNARFNSKRDNLRDAMYIDACGAVIDYRFANEFKFRIGDRVINKYNDSDLIREYRDTPEGVAMTKQPFVANGDVGTIVRYYPEKDDEFVLVRLDDGAYVQIGVGEFYSAWKQAWVITVHASQGSEYKHVILAVQTDVNTSFENRSLVYTAITRASQDVYVVGSFDGTAKAIAAKREPRKARLPMF